MPGARPTNKAAAQRRVDQIEAFDASINSKWYAMV